ncbi:MAG: DUF5716 family protein, partial [Lachnospiraceae bacterium]|nr:DUF5716 family protein [Lachnospiraceae bacterium]
DLVAMLMDSLEADFEDADFSEEAAEDAGGENAENLSGKAHLLLRKLKETGWIETEYEAKSFEEHITIPDYAVDVMNLLYELSTERVREYNSYVYATYAALVNAKDNSEYVYQALHAAWQNTVHLVDELKSLFNNIRRYYARIPGEDDVNALLSEHFEEYKAKVVDVVYYPLKTIDSVPRFKHAIVTTLNAWLLDEDIQDRIIRQGVSRRVFENEEDGREQMFTMINYIVDTYESIEEMIGAIDRRHTEYINASIEHIRYLMNSDRGVRGKLIELLRASRDPGTAAMMSEGIRVFRHQYYDDRSLYAEAKRTKREMGPPLSIKETGESPELISNFLRDVRSRYTDKKVDAFILKCLGDKDSCGTEEINVESADDFIMLLLGTIRAGERSAPYTVSFRDDYVNRNGYDLPGAYFRRKMHDRR